MFSTLITVTLFVSLAIQGTFAAFAVNSPKLVECTDAIVSWSHSVPPYSLEMVLAANPCGGSALLTVTNHPSTTYQDYVTVKPGTRVQFFVSDSSGNEAWSNVITVGSNSSACASSAPTTTPPSTADNKATPHASPTSSVPGLGGAINAGSSSSGMPTLHRASTPLLFTALAALLALTL